MKFAAISLFWSRFLIGSYKRFAPNFVQAASVRLVTPANSAFTLMLVTADSKVRTTLCG